MKFVLLIVAPLAVAWAAWVGWHLEEHQVAVVLWLAIAVEVLLDDLGRMSGRLPR
jgi:hypothetical protein